MRPTIFVHNFSPGFFVHLYVLHKCLYNLCIFTKSFSSFLEKCPHHLNLLHYSTVIISSAASWLSYYYTWTEPICYISIQSFSSQLYYYHYYNHFTTLCLGLPRWVGTRRTNHSGFCWSRHNGVAVASAELYASYLHFTPEDNHASTSTVRFMGRMPFLTLNQQHQSTEGHSSQL